MMKQIPPLGLVILLISALVLSGCGETSLNLPDARDLCLSAYKDLYKLEYWPDETPVPHDEFSQEYEPYPEYAESDYETRYVRVFWGQDSCEIHRTDLKLASGDCIRNDVRVYGSVETAEKAFADMRVPRFGFSDVNIYGTPGTEWGIPSVGDESNAWRFAQRVLDEKREVMVTQHEVEICFRKGPVISSVKVVVWGNDNNEVESFLLCVARLSEEKISKSISME